MSSPATKTQFLQQFEQIVNGVLKNKSKVGFQKTTCMSRALIVLRCKDLFQLLPQTFKKRPAGSFSMVSNFQIILPLYDIKNAKRSTLY